MSVSVSSFADAAFVPSATAPAAVSAAATQVAGALTVSLNVTNPVVHQARPISVGVTVTNTSSKTLIGVLPSVSQAAGDLLVTKLATPSIAALAAGKSVVFKYTLEELVIGTSTLTANAFSPYATSTGAASVAMTTLPASAGKTAITDASGNAFLKVGSYVVPVHLADQNTGVPVAGLALSIASTDRQNSRAVIAMVDSQGRYPVQMAVLEGSATVTGSTTPTLVDVATGTSSAFSAAVSAIETSYLPLFSTTQPAGSISTAFLAALKAIAASKLPVPASFAGTGEPKTLYSSRPIAISDLAQKVTTVSTEFGLTNTVGEAIIETGVDTNQAVQPGSVQVADAAEMTMTGGDLATSLANSIYDETNVQSVDLNLVNAGGIPYFVLAPVAPPGGAPITWTPKSATEDVTIDPVYSSGQPIIGGSYELISQDDLAADIVGVLPTSGSLSVPVELGNYQATFSAPGYQPSTDDSVDVTSKGASVAPKLAAETIASGTLTSVLGQPTGFLAAGTQYYLTPHFFDSKGNELPVSGTGPYTVNGKPVIFFASNPVGATVATVDPLTGLVTMGSGFGAGLITAWCDGVTTTAKLVSTNGNGKYPVQPPHSFVVSPGALHFTAQEGGANPPDQTYDIMPLSSSFQNYTYTTHNGWASEAPTNVNNYNIMDVSVDTTGLGPGTYSVPMTITDSASHYSQTVIVTLTITPQPPATLSSGTYVGNWTYPVFGFGDDYTTLTFHLQQTGSNVTGSWDAVVLDGSVDTTGDSNGDTFYTGTIVGDTITLVDHSETTFIGKISGNTITGTSNYLQAQSSFTVSAQG